MTDQYTKLADELDATAGNNSDMYEHERDSCREAARILRAAAGADVAGLMDVADRYALAQADPAHWRAALESDLRLALAAREDDVFTALDMSPDTFRTEGGAVNVGKLRAAIRHPADYLPADHWLAAAAPKGTP